MPKTCTDGGGGDRVRSAVTLHNRYARARQSFPSLPPTSQKIYDHAMRQHRGRHHVSLEQEQLYARALLDKLLPLILPPQYCASPSTFTILREVIVGYGFRTTFDYYASKEFMFQCVRKRKLAFALRHQSLWFGVSLFEYIRVCDSCWCHRVVLILPSRKDRTERPFNAVLPSSFSLSLLAVRYILNLMDPPPDYLSPELPFPSTTVPILQAARRPLAHSGAT